MLFKVCTSDRQKRKFVKIDNGTVTELLAKVSAVLGIEGAVGIVTERDGCEIDDDDVLQELKSDLIMVLGENEKWVSTEEQTAARSLEDPTSLDRHSACSSLELSVAATPPRTETASACFLSDSVAKAGSSSMSVLVSATPPRTETASACLLSDSVAKAGPSSTSVLVSSEPPSTVLSPVSGINKKFTVPLPTLSTFVADSLKSGKLLACLNNLVTECAHFYLNKYPITNSVQYQEVGEQLYLKYPCIKFPRGSEPWTVFCDKLSQKIRNLRFHQKRKSLTTDHSNAPKAVKQSKFTSNSVSLDLISEDEYKKHVAEICVEMGKLNRNTQHIQLLLMETHMNRRKWLRDLPPFSWAPLVKTYPCFEDIEHVIYEYQLLQNKQDLKSESENLEKLFKLTAKNVDKKIEGTDTEKEIQLINYLEKVTAFDKGKGKKTESILTTKKDVAEENIEKACATKELTAPKLICFMSSDNKLMEVAIAGDCQTIFCKTNSLIESLLYLVIVYYITDLNFPRQYSQLLGLIQQYVINENFDGAVSGKFMKFCVYLDAAWKKSE